MFLAATFLVDGAQQQQLPDFFLFHLRKTLGKEDSRDTSESSKNNGISVFAVKGEILRKFTAMCILVHLVCA